MKTLWVIAGPTASGKTALAVELAERLGAEVVSADSQQVYRHFDIGTAKPSPEELRRVRHHLISVVEPDRQFSVAEYVQLADAAIADIHARRKPVVVAGGTGLYIRALLHGVVPVPPVDLPLRRSLEAEAETHGAAALHAKLAAVDAPSALRISVNDVLRIVRALELHQLTGQAASALREAHRFAADRHPYRLFVLAPTREALAVAIEERTRALAARGWLKETRALVQSGFRDAAPMKSVGYRQMLRVCDGEWDEETALADIALETRRYAKRQLTWFRREKGARFVAPPYPKVELLGD